MALNVFTVFKFRNSCMTAKISNTFSGHKIRIQLYVYTLVYTLYMLKNTYITPNSRKQINVISIIVI